MTPRFGIDQLMAVYVLGLLTPVAISLLLEWRGTKCQ